jgi:hypothetical protein
MCAETKLDTYLEATVEHSLHNGLQQRVDLLFVLALSQVIVILGSQSLISIDTLSYNRK